MGVAKVTISIESGLLKKVDYRVKERVFSNRSQAIQSAVAEKVLLFKNGFLELKLISVYFLVSQK